MALVDGETIRKFQNLDGSITNLIIVTVTNSIQ